MKSSLAKPWRFGQGIFLCFSVGVLAFGIVLVAASPWYTLSVNLSNSLDGRVYLIRKGVLPRKGDLVAYRWQGGATYPAGVIFVKRVTGVSGDVVRREGHHYWINEKHIGIAKAVSMAGVPLDPAVPGEIPAREYFVSTPHPDSLDSRYALSGNIEQAHIVGRAHVLF